MGRNLFSALCVYRTMRTTAQKHRLIWGGFAALLTGAVVSGYVPDMMLVSAMRGARAEGLLALPPATRVAKERDARPLYASAGQKYPQAPYLLSGDFARQVKKPAPHVAKYLEAMARASARPECSRIVDGWSRYDERVGVRLPELYFAAKAMVARAGDEAALLPAARIARHIRSQEDVRPLGYWAALVQKTLDRGAKIGLDRAALARLGAALGPPVAPREAVRLHFARTVAEYERETLERGARVSRTREQAAYVRFWRGFLARAPRDGKGFIQAVRGSESEIARAESSGLAYTDLSGIVGASLTPWMSWATLLDRADQRIGALR